MRRLSFAVVCLAWLPVAAQAEESLSPNLVTAVKAATVFVKFKTPEIAGSGSGFVVESEGKTAYIVTNRHVVEPIVIEWRRATRRGSPRAPRIVVHEYKNVEVEVVFQSGGREEQSVRGELVAVDPDKDLAIVKASDVKQMPKPIDYRHEPKLAETMPIYTFGFPLGDELVTSKRSPAITVGKGSVSSLRTDDDGNVAVVQIDAALNHGNSGGPVVDAHGRLVGVAVARIGDSENISLAIPSRAVSRLLQGRLDKVEFATVRDNDGRVSIRVSAALIDPLSQIKSAEFDYLAAKSVADKPKPADRLDALDGCYKLKLTIENGKATGSIPLKKGISEVSLLHQAVSTYGDGKRVRSNNLTETVKVAAVAGKAPQTPKPGMTQPVIPVVPGGYVASKNSPVFHKAGCKSAARISEKNLVHYATRDEAIRAGKTPCKECNP